MYRTVPARRTPSYSILRICQMILFQSLTFKMKSPLLTIFIVLVSFSRSTSQSNCDSLSHYSQQISLDTAISPDYYEIEIKVAEIRQYTGKGKKRKSYTISIDSINQIIRTQLFKAGINVPINLIQISEVDTRYPYYDLFQGTFQLTLSSKNDIELVFNTLLETFKENFKGMVVNPNINAERLDLIKKEMEAKVFQIIKTGAEEFALKNNVEIVRNSQYIFGFHKKYITGELDSYGYVKTKAFNISFSNPVYVIDFNGSFELK